MICTNHKDKNEHTDQWRKPIGDNIFSEEFCSDLLRFEDFCKLFQPTSEIRATSKLLIDTIFFLDYDFSDEDSLWQANYGLPVHVLVYIERFLDNVPKRFVTDEVSVGIILAAIVSAR